MISLKGLFKRNTLNDQGARLSKIVTGHLVNSDEQCLVDFGGVSTISSLFFQDFIFPLVIEFGGETITNRLKLINLSDEHFVCYQLAVEKSSDYLDRVFRVNYLVRFDDNYSGRFWLKNTGYIITFLGFVFFDNFLLLFQ